MSSASPNLKVVFVTGCSRGGIGFSLCEEFAVQGCKVYATARRLEAMEGFAHENIQCLQLDVTNEDNVQGVVSTIVEREGRIDVVVNNAGVMCSGPFIDVLPERILSTYDTNVFSILRIARAAIPHMASRRSGTIVNISSIVGETPMPWGGVYASTKAAVTSISEVLYMECMPFNISVMLVTPGGVKTNISDTMLKSFSLPPITLYSTYLTNMIARMQGSQASNSMRPEVFSKRVVTAALSKRPPRYMMLGSYSLLFRFFKWLPRTWLLGMLWGVATGKH